MFEATLVTRFRKTMAMVVLTVICAGIWLYSKKTAPGLEEVRLAYESDDYAKVGLIWRSLDPPSQDDAEVLWYVGLACKSLGEDLEAIAHFRRIVETSGDSDIALDAALQIVAIQQKLGQYASAINLVESLVDSHPARFDLRSQAANLLDLAGRRYEANLHRFVLVKANVHSIDDLILLADRNEPYVGPETERVLQNPKSTEFRVTRAIIARNSGKLDEAEKLLREEIAQDEAILEPHALLGLVLLDQGQMSALADWHATLPPSSDDHPDVWYVRGAWAEHLNRNNVAATCYLKALRLDADLKQAIFRLSIVGADAVSDDVRPRLNSRIKRIEEYRIVCKSIFFKGPGSGAVTRAIELAESLNRFHEAISWCRIQRSSSGSLLSIDEKIGQLETQLNASASPDVQTQWNLNSDFPLSESMISEWPAPQDSQDFRKPAPFEVQFENEAAKRGLMFRYENGTDKKSGLMIYESMGGGVAVLDFDRDAWPDVFFPQGESAAGSTNDGLYRNISGQSFARVDVVAGCGDRDYSHGAAIGDINDDGFPDVYVANKGCNRLYVNNGDGSFSTAIDQFKTQKWTISCAIADLNGDAYPELFDVNYLEWGRPFTEVCIDGELGLPRTCPPERFEGERNDVYLNSGDGEFRDVTDEIGLGDVIGKGLGIVAGSFNNTGQNSIFVANDQEPNSYFQLVASPSGSAAQLPRFSNQAYVAGLALNGSGEALACMGVASADVNHDGYLDLFVTNFYRQPNTLYVSLGNGGFQDATGPSGLIEPGLLNLGFGTQFLDANLDAEPDLIVGNGHLDDFSHKGIPFAMQPQLFLNKGEMEFEESPAVHAGEYFQKPHIARGIALLDWNCDGLEDFAVSHIGEIAGLVTNRTAKHGHFLSVRIFGQQSARDAVGATIKLTTRNFTRWKHLTSGDGYASSNEKVVHFGLGTELMADSLSIQWPSGQTQEFLNVDGDREYIAIESVDRLFAIPR